MDALFIENPDKRRLFPSAFPVGAALTGRQFTSVYIEVSTATYLTQHFQDWVKYDVLTRLPPNASPIVIMLKQWA